MCHLHYLGKKAFETVLPSQGLKGWKGRTVPKGRSSLTPLGIHATPYQKLAPPLSVNQYVPSSPPSPSVQVLKTKDSLSWLSGRPTCLSAEPLACTPIDLLISDSLWHWQGPGLSC